MLGVAISYRKRQLRSLSMRDIVDGRGAVSS
jgi:hypothetical protein